MHRDRLANRWSVEVSAYVHPGHRRRGVGKALYLELFSALADRGFCRALAGVNLADVEFQPRAAPVTGTAGARYEAAFARVGALVGARRLGYTMTAAPPGKRAFPFHSHRVNEEILRPRGDR